MTVYGPHRPEDEPATGIVWDQRGKTLSKAEIPLHPLMQEQRRQINHRAWKATR